MNMNVSRMLWIGTALLTAVQSALGFYNPQTGRWLNRDPIREPGAISSSASAASVETAEEDSTDLEAVDGDYLFVRNDSPSHTDYLGLAPEVAQNSNCCESHKNPETDCKKICARAQAAVDEIVPKGWDGLATVVCYGDTMCPCVLSWDKLDPSGRLKIGLASCPGLNAIAEAHEKDGHMDGSECKKCGLYAATSKEGRSLTAEDCKQRKADIPKLKDYIKNAATEPGGADCKRAAEILKAKHEKFIKEW